MAHGPIPDSRPFGGFHPNCGMAILQPGEQICNRRYPADVAFHPARLARLDYGAPPPLPLPRLPLVVQDHNRLRPLAGSE